MVLWNVCYSNSLMIVTIVMIIMITIMMIIIVVIVIVVVIIHSFMEIRFLRLPSSIPRLFHFFDSSLSSIVYSLTSVLLGRLHPPS